MKDNAMLQLTKSRIDFHVHLMPDFTRRTNNHHAKIVRKNFHASGAPA
jgi:hypothetical protein